MVVGINDTSNEKGMNMDIEVDTRNGMLEISVLTGVRDFLRRSPPDFEGAINKIEANWSKKKSRSTQNWRLLHVPLEKNSGYNDTYVHENVC